MLNIYADRGNLLILQKRCEWRGIKFDLTAIGIGDALEPEQYDLFYLGGGQDRDQLLCADDLVKNKKTALYAAAKANKVILGICGGYQLLGKYYELDGRKIEGLGLLDLITVREAGPRLIGNVSIALELSSGTSHLAGFENHGGRTYLSEGQLPLGKVLKGSGNNGQDGYEGARSKNVIGTYMHGPLLPKNSWFADWLLSKALDIKLEQLEQLDDRLESLAHQAALGVR